MEPQATLQRTINALKNQSFPRKQIHLMISFEEREGIPAKDKANHSRLNMASVW
jgi:hypothetical protein